MKRPSSHNLLIVVAMTFGLGLAASGYLNYVQFSRAQDDKAALNGQLTDLRYQLKQDSTKVSTTPSPKSSASPIPSPSPTITPTVLGATTMKMDQLGVYLSASDPVSDLTYSYTSTTDGAAVANLITTGLLTQYPACKPGLASLGQIVRRAKTSKVRAPVGSVPLKPFGDYTYYYNKGTGACASDTAGRSKLAAARAAILDATLPTLAATN